MLGNGMRVTMVVRRRQCTVPPFSKRRRADARKRTGQRYAGYDTRLVSPNFPCKTKYCQSWSESVMFSVVCKLRDELPRPAGRRPVHLARRSWPCASGVARRASPGPDPLSGCGDCVRRLAAPLSMSSSISLPLYGGKSAASVRRHALLSRLARCGGGGSRC
jgi:hypothetical protein